MKLIDLFATSMEHYVGANKAEQYWNLVERFDVGTQSEVAQTLNKYRKEIAYRELDLQRQGLKGVKLDNERANILIDLLRLDRKYGEADKIAGLVGAVVGAGAKAVGAAAGWKSASRALPAFKRIGGYNAPR
jgi:hypothetical protein